MFSAFVENEIRSVSAQRDLDPALVLAVADVESGGRALTEIGGRPMPCILYEYHVFHRRLSPGLRGLAVECGLAARRWGALPYPRAQRERYALLERARRLDREAAFAACSWGVGQVLGENARWLGYESAEALADEAISGVAGQVRLMMRFIDKRGLESALRAQDWESFARGYNGPSHAKHDYAGRLARAAAHWRDCPVAPPSEGFIAFGDRGPQVEAIQRALNRCGAALIPDGDFGHATRAAVRSFQAQEGLVRDGVVGAQTRARLRHAAQNAATV